MKKIIFILLLFIVSIDSVDARWYGNSTGSNIRDGYHWQGYDTTPVIQNCSDDGNGQAGAQVYGGTINPAPAVSSMRCQWWDNEVPVATLGPTSGSWINGNHSVSIWGYDVGGSGYNTRRWCQTQNSGGCTPSNTTLWPLPTMTAEGENYITMYIEDNVGFSTTRTFGPYRIDKTAPGTAIITSSHTQNAWNNTSGVSFNISNTINAGPSPVTTTYCIHKSSSPCNPNTTGTSYNGILSDGIWTFSARNSDTGGTGPVSSYTIYVDTQIPDGNANPANRLTWSNVSTLNINLSTADVTKDGSQSGIASSTYVVNQNSGSPFGGTCSGTSYSTSTTHTDFAEGTNYIHLCSMDNAGNQYTETFGYYLVDLTDPLISDNYGANAGVWQNTSQTITFTATDAHSGIRYMRYCLGSGCTPTTLMGGEVTPVGTNSATRSLTFTPVTDTFLRYQAFDYATRQSIIGEIDIKIENIVPTASAPIYYDGRDNNTIASQRNISYGATDTGGSGLEVVTLQRRVATTNNAGGYGAFGSWQDAQTNSGLSGNSFSRTYSQPFTNGRAMQFRVVYEDEAGNIGIIAVGTNVLRMDDVDPTVTDNYANDGTWVNTAQTITFSLLDNDSGIPNNVTGRRYCTGPVGNTCTPTTYLPNTLSFSPETEITLRYETTDRAGNDSTAIGSIDILIEDNRPTGTISYYDGRDNNTIASQRNISYSAVDTGGSGLENVALQRQISDTNNAGGLVGNWTAWADVPGHTNTGLNVNNLNRSYIQPFQNGKAVRFRVIINDEATNDINAQGYIDSTNVIRMDNVDPTVTDNYTNDGTWVNTAQTITFSLLDNDSGIPNNVTGRRYCTGAVGNTCTPSIYLPNSLTYNPNTEITLRYETTDRAGNDSTAIGSIDILIEDNRPTGTISYYDGRDNNGRHGITAAQSISNRTISYSAADTGGSRLENVILQRQISDTNNAGGLVGNWTAWADVPGHSNVGLNVNNLNRSYIQPFQNGKAVRFRVIINDEATNDINVLGYITSTDILRMDDVDPTVTDNYTNDGTWVNTAQTITFSLLDNDSGIPNNVTGRRYCTGAVGNTCTPSIYLPNSLTYNPNTEITLRYETTDRAGNDSTAIGSIDILIDGDQALGQVSYQDIWTNGIADAALRSVSYSSTDEASGIPNQSNIAEIRLEKRGANTNDDGTIGSYSVWGNADASTVHTPNARVFAATTYTQPFENKRAYQFRTYVRDIAGNEKWIYDTGGSSVARNNATSIPGGLDILKMENEDADATFTNLDLNISANGWTNVTAQSVRIDFGDTGGSLLSSYTLQVSDVTDNPDFTSLGTAPTWNNVAGHTNRGISGETHSVTYNFTGVNDHAYTFQIQITDNAGNTTPWIVSTASLIKIDTVVPVPGDVTSPTAATPILATNNHNFIYDIGRNGGAPIIEAIGSFEDWNSVNSSLASNDNSASDNNPAITDQIDVHHSVQNVDNDRVDPEGHRAYNYRIIRIEDEAGNVLYVPTGLGIANFNHYVYANTLVTEITTKTLNGVANVDNINNVAEGTTDSLSAELRDVYGNAIVKATDIGREIDFRIDISGDSSIFLNQYRRNGGQAIFMQTSNSSGFQDIDDFSTNPNYLSDLDFSAINPGQYDFDFRTYAPTASWYPNTQSVSDPGAKFFITNFQFAVEHNATYNSWDTGDQSLDNGQDIDFKYGPLFATSIGGAIETYGFIEGANQDSTITLQKATSSASPNARELWFEFGQGDRFPSPLLSLQTFSPNRVIGEGNPNATLFTNFSPSPGAIAIDSLLEMERGTTLDIIQNSYLSTHVSYTLDGNDVMYNADIIGKDNYFGNQTGGNTVQGGIKILGQTHSSRQKDIIQDQEQDDLQILGSIYKASLKKNIVKNAYTIIRNSTTNNFGSTDITDLSDITNNSGGDHLFNNSIIFYGDDSTNARVDINLTNNRIRGDKTVLAFGRDIYIESDLYYDNKDTDILGIIALSDENGNGGNIYIDPNITNVVGTLFAEKSIISYDGTNELGGGTSHNILRHQLHIYGSVFSENTIGGSRNNPILCPYYINSASCDQDIAQIYDMNYLRRYFTYLDAGVKVPANNAKVIGGGTCDTFGNCSGGNTNFNRNITNSDTDTYSRFPVVIEYNPSAQTNPAPLFEAN